VTIAILAALGRSEELALHIRATQQTGLTPEEIAEMLLHVAVYAGVPAANSAVAIAKQNLAELDPSPDEAGA
jgi:alkylhydroperoxidase/carboxymuconolactone decarboxylase family protein YurZ